MNGVCWGRKPSGDKLHAFSLPLTRIADSFCGRMSLERYDVSPLCDISHFELRD